MVINRRVRAVVLPLMLYCVSGAVGSYFVWHATNGERGLKAKAQYKSQILKMTGEFSALQREKSVWAHKVDLMRGQTIDRDLLDEEARLVLGRLGREDLVVLLPAGNGRP